MYTLCTHYVHITLRRVDGMALLAWGLPSCCWKITATPRRHAATPPRRHTATPRPEILKKERERERVGLNKLKLSVVSVGLLQEMLVGRGHVCP